MMIRVGRIEYHAETALRLMHQQLTKTDLQLTDGQREILHQIKEELIVVDSLLGAVIEARKARGDG